MSSIKKQEKLRSQYVVAKYKANLSEHVEHVEIPSNPTQKSNYNETR